MSLTVSLHAQDVRAHLDGVPLHIVQRGHNRAPCFFSEADYSCYLRSLDAALTEAYRSLHAYVLMSNHVHLLFTPVGNAW